MGISQHSQSHPKKTNFHPCLGAQNSQDYGDYHDDVNDYDHNHHDNDLYNSFILESDNLDGCLKSVKLSGHIVVEIL